MKKLILLCMAAVMGLALQAQDAVWEPNADRSDLKFMTAANWSIDAVPGATNKTKVVGLPCYLDDAVELKSFVLEGGNDGNVDSLIVQDGGVLSNANYSANEWCGVGYNGSSVLIVETGGVVNTKHRILVAFQKGECQILVNGGAVNIGQNLLLATNGPGNAFVSVKDGGTLTSLGYEIGESGTVKIDIEDGTWTILGSDIVAALEAEVAAGKLVGYGGGGTVDIAFDGTNTVVTAQPDMVPPTIVGTDPAEGATGVPGVKVIEVEFSEPMNIETLKTATTIDRTNPTFEMDGHTLLIGGDEMAVGAPVTVTIGVGAEDGNGVAMENPFTLNFTVAAADAPPTVTGVTPLDGTTGVDVYPTITMSFSKAMDSASVITSLSIPDFNTADTSWSADYKTLTIVGSENPWATTYTVTLAAGALSHDAKPLAAEFSYSFTTKDQPKTDIFWEPKGDGTSDGKWTTTANWRLKDGMLAYPIGMDEYPNGNYRVLFDSSYLETAVLDAAVAINSFQLGVKYASDTLYVKDGGVLKTEGDWCGVGQDTSAVLVVEEGGMVDISSHLWVGRNADVIADIYVNGGTIKVGAAFGLNRNAHAGGVSTVFLNDGLLELGQWAAGNIGAGSKIIIGDGLLKLKNDKTGPMKDALAAGVIENAGTEGKFTVKFEGGFTYVYVDKVAPTVANTDPADDAVDVAVAAEIHIGFSEMMDQDSTLKVVSIAPALTNPIFTWNDTVLSITHQGMDIGTEYVVTVGPEAIDLAGNAMGQAYELSFTTSSVAYYTITFSVNDANGALEGASVTFNSETISTDADGYAVFNDVEEGTGLPYSVSMEGYDTEDGTMIVVTNVMKTVTLVESSGSSIKANSSLTGNIYPNPASDVLSIELASEVEQLEIFNTIGKVVYSVNKLAHNQVIQIDVTDFNKGIYLVKTQQGNTISVDKIVIK